ncbi:hypothetical protein ACXZ9C_11090 [Streptococcus agalactiae]
MASCSSRWCVALVTLVSSVVEHRRWFRWFGFGCVGFVVASHRPSSLSIVVVVSIIITSLSIA